MNSRVKPAKEDLSRGGVPSHLNVRLKSDGQFLVNPSRATAAYAGYIVRRFRRLLTGFATAIGYGLLNTQLVFYSFD